MQFQLFHRGGNVPPPVEQARWVKNEPGWDPMLTGQLADKPTCGQSSRGLDNSQTSQLADGEFKKIMELLHFICTLNLTLIITVTLSNTDSV